MITTDTVLEGCIETLQKCSAGEVSFNVLQDQFDVAASEIRALLLSIKNEQPSYSTKNQSRNYIHCKQYKASELPPMVRYMAGSVFGEVVHHLGLEDHKPLLRFYTEERTKENTFYSSIDTCDGFYLRTETEYVNVKADLPLVEMLKTIIHETYHMYQHRKNGNISAFDDGIENEALLFENRFFAMVYPSLYMLQSYLERTA